VLDGTQLEVSGVPTAVAQSWFFRRTAAQAFLPARVLARYATTFDYPGRRFRLDRSGRQGKGIEVRSPVSNDERFARVEAVVAGERYGMLLDTGASHCMVSNALMERWASAHPDWPVLPAALGTANMATTAVDRGARMISVPELDIDGVTVRNVSFVTRPEGSFEEGFAPMMTEPIVGAIAGNVLELFRLTIDYDLGVTYFDPADVTVPVAFAAPFSIDADDNTFRVLDVLPGLPLREGDRLMAIDGAPVPDDFAQLWQRLTNLSPSTIQVTLQRDNVRTTQAVDLIQI
jgi:hypothetical protein